MMRISKSSYRQAVFFFSRQTGLLRTIISNPFDNIGASNLFGLSLDASKEHLVGGPYGDLPEMPDSDEVHQFSFQFNENLN